MSEETERAKQIDSAVKAADKARADAVAADADAGQKLDHLLSCVDALCSRMDAFEAMDKKKAADADDPADEKPDYFNKKSGERPYGDTADDPDKPRELGADSRKDSVRADAAYYANMASAQSEADVASSAWGNDAPRPWDGETTEAYRRRSAHAHKQYSTSWKDVDLGELKGQALKNATAQIFADSIAASTSSATYGEALREVRRRDEAGHTIREFYGEPRAWMQAFSGGLPRLARFNLDRTNRG